MINDILLSQQPKWIGVITHTMLKRGADLIQIRESKDYRGQADTFAEYLSQNDVRKDAKLCMALVEYYILHHGLEVSDIHDIHHDRLKEVMEKLPDLPTAEIDEWLEACRELSWKDLLNKIRRARGKPPMPFQAKDNLLDPSPSCCICGATPVEDAHWPITKKMGGAFTIPLCRECHNEYHQHGDTTFYDHYKRKIGEWLAKQLGEKKGGKK